MSPKQKQIFDLIRISIHRTANLAKAGKRIDDNLQEVGFYVREFSEVYISSILICPNFNF